MIFAFHPSVPLPLVGNEGGGKKGVKRGTCLYDATIIRGERREFDQPHADDRRYFVLHQYCSTVHYYEYVATGCIYNCHVRKYNSLSLIGSHLTVP
jgi:hypothetical protein